MQNVLFFFSVFYIKYASGIGGLQCPPGAPVFTKQCEGASECEAGTPPAGTGCTCGCACCGSGEVCDELVGDCIKAEGEGEGTHRYSVASSSPPQERLFGSIVVYLKSANTLSIVILPQTHST